MKTVKIVRRTLTENFFSALLFFDSFTMNFVYSVIRRIYKVIINYSASHLLQLTAKQSNL